MIFVFLLLVATFYSSTYGMQQNVVMHPVKSATSLSSGQYYNPTNQFKTDHMYAVRNTFSVREPQYPLCHLVGTTQERLIFSQVQSCKTTLVNLVYNYKTNQIIKAHAVFDVLTMTVSDPQIQKGLDQFALLATKLLFNKDGSPVKFFTSTQVEIQLSKAIVDILPLLSTGTIEYVQMLSQLKGISSILDSVIDEKLSQHNGILHRIMQNPLADFAVDSIKFILEIPAEALQWMKGATHDQILYKLNKYKNRIYNNYITKNYLQVVLHCKKGCYEQAFKYGKEHALFVHMPWLEHALRQKITDKFPVDHNRNSTMEAVEKHAILGAQPITTDANCPALVNDVSSQDVTSQPVLTQYQQDQLITYKNNYEEKLVTDDKDPTTSSEVESRLCAIDQTLANPDENYLYNYQTSHIDQDRLAQLGIDEHEVSSSQGVPITHHLHQEALVALDNATKMENITSSDEDYISISPLYRAAAQAVAASFKLTKASNFDASIKVMDFAQALIAMANELYLYCGTKKTFGLTHSISRGVSSLNAAKVEQATTNLLVNPAVLLAIPTEVITTTDPTVKAYVDDFAGAVETAQKDFPETFASQRSRNHNQVIEKFTGSFRLIARNKADWMPAYLGVIAQGVAMGIRNAVLSVYDIAHGAYEIVTHVPEILSLVEYTVNNPVKAISGTYDFIKAVIFDSSTESKIEFGIAYGTEQLVKSTLVYARGAAMLRLGAKAVRNFVNTLKSVRRSKQLIYTTAGPAIRITVNASENISHNFNQLKHDLDRVVKTAVKLPAHVVGNFIQNIIDHPVTQKLVKEYGYALMEEAANILRVEKNFFNKLGNVEKIQKIIARLQKINMHDRWHTFKHDWAHGGKVSFGSIQEAQAAIACEEQKILKGFLTRAKEQGADFIENLSNEIKIGWDIKTPMSYISSNGKTQIDFQGPKGFWSSLSRAIKTSNDFIIINITDLTQEHLSEFFTGLKSTYKLEDIRKMVIIHAEKPKLSMSNEHLIKWYNSL